MIPLIPDNAPFSPAQRAWLNGFLAGLYGGAEPTGLSVARPQEAEAFPAHEFPWHDPSLELEERLALAEGKPLAQRLMAAMAQLDCGQCGYLCQTYSEALAEGRENSTSLCVPGAKMTTRALKRLLADAPTPASARPASVDTRSTPPMRQVRVLAANRLSGPGSAKDVRHIVIDLADSGLVYTPGDSLSLTAPADPALVEACLAALGASDDTKLRAAFTHQVDIARPLDRTLDVLAMCANRSDAAALRRLAEGEDGAEPDGADLLDLLQAFPSARPPVGDLLRSLPALKPRLYSIASSLRATPGQVHLCVSVVRAERRGRVRYGVASAFLAKRAVAHGPLGATVTPSHFRLPTERKTPIIMVGPGTGIAPFRAFLQERAATGNTGRAWLFFGDQHAAHDFLFREELQAWLADGTLSRLDTAFSRDQKQKLYVQDRIADAAEDIWRWLQDGAHFYVCGDASRMARDVDLALRGVSRRVGGLNDAQAQDWIVALARQGRYLRDVY